MGPKQRRSVAFAAALVCMTCAGTIYLFSAYAQALKQKRGLSQTALNAIASAGGFGQYLSGPVWGKLSDIYDRSRLCAVAGILLLSGYLTLALGYTTPTLPTYVLAFSYLSIGLGSSGIFNSALATTVKNFPPSEHGFRIGLPVSLFGLSAFLFSQLQRLFTDSGTGVVDIASFLIFVGVTTGGGAILASQLLFDCSTSLLRRTHHSLNSDSTAVSSDSDSDSQEIIESPTTEHSQLVDIRVVYAQKELPLFIQRDAWLLFISFILLAGTGLMYINNVGAVVVALSPLNASPSEIQSTQRLHVGILSLCNCAGRIATGMGSDVLINRFKLSRLVGMVTGAVLISLSLLVAMGELVPGGEGAALVHVTVLLGLGYGAIFSAAPAIVSRWFGVDRFGANWGWFQWAPALGGQICNLVFGLYLDAAKGAGGECRGTACFMGAFRVALVGCIASVGLLLVLNAMRGGFKVHRLTDV
ncbi:hypothetical protein HDU98_003684 [Podochytrium sp. JEL0797]|nr:hypothetical protein HDU98_003684 [Podochytrium sp. JEL0797]